jgi:hypothetical protein
MFPANHGANGLEQQTLFMGNLPESIANQRNFR